MPPPCVSETVQESVLCQLTGPQLAAAEALLAGATKTEAAQAAGVTVRTVNRYLADPAFAGVLQQATSDDLAALAAGTAAALAQARAVLLALMTDQSVAPGVRIRAATAVLDYALRIYEKYDLAARVAALEELIHDAKTQA